MMENIYFCGQVVEQASLANLALHTRQGRCFEGTTVAESVFLKHLKFDIA